MRWWRRRRRGDTAGPAPSSAGDWGGAPRAGASAASDPHRPWQDLCSATALRLLDLAGQMSGELDTAMRDQGDPDVLDHLYKLDSFACQARRHAENLQALAGRPLLDSDRQITSLTDIIQAARGRIAGWQAVTVGSMAHIAVGEYVASDVIRVMTELLDNAVEYSPAGGPVTASGHLVADGGVLLRVEDTGIGIAEADLRRFNAFLQDPPSGTVRGLQQGFAVIQRAIAAHCIRVFLATRSHGTTAHVYIPAGLLCEIPADAAVGRAVADVPAMDRSWPSAQVAPPPPAVSPVSSPVAWGTVRNDAPGSMPTRKPQRMRELQAAPPSPGLEAERGSGTDVAGGALAGIAEFDAATREES
jgi:hypothetical protein